MPVHWLIDRLSQQVTPLIDSIKLHGQKHKITLICICFLSLSCSVFVLRLVVNQEGQPLIEGKLKEKQVRWKFIKRWKTRYFTLAGNQLLFRRGKSVRSQRKGGTHTFMHGYTQCAWPLTQKTLINLAVIWNVMKHCVNQWKSHLLISSAVPQVHLVKPIVTDLGPSKDSWGTPEAKASCCKHMSHSPTLTQNRYYAQVANPRGGTASYGKWA